MILKLIGLLAFVLTSSGLLVSTLIDNFNISTMAVLFVFGCFFTISLVDHFNEIKN